MGLELYNASKCAMRIFDEADAALGFPLAELTFKGPDEDLQDTINSQPAIMTVSIACWNACEEILGHKLPTPVSMAGHSLGEYTSLVAAGVLGFSDGVRLVRERGRLMQEASKQWPGGMAAILGLNELVMEEICDETGVELGNINSDEQIVISGDKLAVARAMDLAHARGAKKTIPLPVSGAFHSSLMAYAQEGLEDTMAGMHFEDPRAPIIANCDCRPLTTGEQVKEELIHGLCRCVQWKNSVTYMVNSGVSSFVEFGPSKVLTSLIKRIEPNVQTIALSNPVSIRKLAEITN